MKNLENYGVQEMSTKEQVKIDGGYSVTRGNTTRYYRQDGHGGWECYKTIRNGRRVRP